MRALSKNRRRCTANAMLSGIAVLLIVALASISASCGDDEPTGCSAEGSEVNGIKGIVLPPEGCDLPYSDATLSARSGAGETVTVQTTPQGEFSIPDAADGNWHISADKGPFQSDLTLVVVAGGKSTYVILRMR